MEIHIYYDPNILLHMQLSILKMSPLARSISITFKRNEITSRIISRAEFIRTSRVVNSNKKVKWNGVA